LASNAASDVIEVTGQAAAPPALRESLDRLRVIDVDAGEINGLPARRALTHYLHGRFGGVSLEQSRRTTSGC
jgi:hypothetical protein